MLFLARVPGFGGRTEPDGLLCSDFLRRFKLIFDYPRQDLIIEPGRDFRGETPFASTVPRNSAR